MLFWLFSIDVDDYISAVIKDDCILMLFMTGKSFIIFSSSFVRVHNISDVGIVKIWACT